MDFKDYRAHRGWKAFEYAKDVAAFSNHLGGTLVIGATEDGHLREYAGLTDDEATAGRQSFSNAVADSCIPRPVVDFSPPYGPPHDPTNQSGVLHSSPSG